MKVLRIAVALLIALIAAYGISFKLGFLPMRPRLFAALAGCALAAILPLLVVAIREFLGRPGRRLRALASTLALGGVWIAFAGGMAN